MILAERTLQEMKNLWSGQVPHEENFIYQPVLDSVRLLGTDRLKRYGEILGIKDIESHFVVADSKNFKVDAKKVDAEGPDRFVSHGMFKTVWQSRANRLANMSGTFTKSFYSLKLYYNAQSIFQFRGGR